ncbi:hemolysin family protein [Jonesia quinghaiensis]|uniref:hemolysin family protein n=1 Tax=Jonesia quinghaiensis TaxID=262806 RepID=UPI000403381D|nr:hemolysin family protein [Jonesia quinghaiensis]
MDADTLANIGLVFLFVFIGGVFAGTEFALVSLRESQINRIEQRGPRGRRVASVARDPNRFLAAVQIGVTVAGFLSAAYGASTLAPDFVPVLLRLGMPEAVAEPAALLGLTLMIAYLSLVFGELVPKRIALQRSEQVALAVGPPLDRFATLMRPVIWLLSRSTNAVVRLLGGDPTARTEDMSQEELREIVIAHEGLPDDERQLLSDVFSAAERSIGEVMRPRGEVVFVDASMTLADAADVVRDQPYSRYPVIGDGFDDIHGFVHIRDILQAPLGRSPAKVTVRDVVRHMIEFPVTNKLLPSLRTMQAQGIHVALVVDEYGGTDGIVTMEDLVEELVGDIRDEYDPLYVVQAAGTYNAGLTIEEFAEQTGIALVDGPYETVAGFVLAQLGRLAEVGDEISVDSRTIRVVEVDGRRITAVSVA